MTMIATRCSATDMDACKYVEVLTCEISGEKKGYAIGGARNGPDALVCGDTALMAPLFDRLLDLPTLPWMWGRLFLLNIESLEQSATGDLTRLLPDVTFAGAIMLPYRRAAHAGSIASGYWTTLRLMQSIGMIEGRGVPRNIDIVPFTSHV